MGLLWLLTGVQWTTACVLKLRQLPVIRVCYPGVSSNTEINIRSTDLQSSLTKLVNPWQNGYRLFRQYGYTFRLTPFDDTSRFMQFSQCTKRQSFILVAKTITNHRMPSLRLGKPTITKKNDFSVLTLWKVHAYSARLKAPLPPQTRKAAKNYLNSLDYTDRKSVV